MKLLVVEAEAGNARTVNAALTAAGHELVSCVDDEDATSCRSVRRPASCPLDGTVDLVVVTRAVGSPDTLAEMGAVCAERHHVPVVRMDPNTTVEAEDVDRVVARAVASGQDRIEAAYAAVVRAALADQAKTVEVLKFSARVWVDVKTPDSRTPSERATLADRARAAVRAHDPFVDVIDISVSTHGT